MNPGIIATFSKEIIFEKVTFTKNFYATTKHFGISPFKTKHLRFVFFISSSTTSSSMMSSSFASPLLPFSPPPFPLALWCLTYKGKEAWKTISWKINWHSLRQGGSPKVWKKSPKKPMKPMKQTREKGWRPQREGGWESTTGIWDGIRSRIQRKCDKTS